MIHNQIKTKINEQHMASINKTQKIINMMQNIKQKCKLLYFEKKHMSRNLSHYQKLLNNNIQQIYLMQNDLIVDSISEYKLLNLLNEISYYFENKINLIIQVQKHFPQDYQLKNDVNNILETLNIFIQYDSSELSSSGSLNESPNIIQLSHVNNSSIMQRRKLN